MTAKDYYTAIYDKLEVTKYHNLDHIQDVSKLNYIIKSVHERTSSTGKSDYYRNFLFDNENHRIESNIMELDNISCRINEEEKWEVVKEPNHHGVALSVVIIDKIGKSKELKFDNTLHNCSGFKDLMNYLNFLLKYSTHDAIETIKYKDHEIDKLKNKVKFLEGKIKSSF